MEKIEKIKKENTVDLSMVESDNFAGDWVDAQAEAENLALMRRIVFQYFRTFDRNDLQLISQEEMIEVSIPSDLSLIREDAVVAGHQTYTGAAQTCF